MFAHYSIESERLSHVQKKRKKKPEGRKKKDRSEITGEAGGRACFKFSAFSKKGPPGK